MTPSPLRVGVASSEPETDADGGQWFFTQVHRLGLQEVRLVLYRNNPELLPRIQHALTLRGRARVSVTLVDDPDQPLEGFPAWAAGAARALPPVYRFIVWNEPNNPALWPHPADEYGQLLRDTAHAIRQARPAGVEVSGYGLAASHHPLLFLEAADGLPPRTSISVHLYPGGAADGHRGSLALIRRLKRMTRASIYVDEFGWQVAPACTEARQASLYQALLGGLQGQTRVRAALVYRLRDGEGWTAGPFRLDGTQRAAGRVLAHAAARAAGPA